MRMLHFLILLVACVIASALTTTIMQGPCSATAKPGIISGEEFRLTDKKGNTRAGMGFDKNDIPVIYIANEKKAVQVYLALSNDKPLLVMKDKNGSAKVSLSLSDDSSPLFIFNGENDKASLAIAQDKNHETSLVFYDTTKKPRFISGVSGNYPRQLYLDDNRNIKMILNSNKDGSAYLGFSEANNSPDIAIGRTSSRAGFMVSTKNGDGFYATKDDTGEPIIMMRKNGDIAWSMPAARHVTLPAFNFDDQTNKLMEGIIK